MNEERDELEKTAINKYPKGQIAKDNFFTYDLKEGDIVVVTNVGAYNLTFSNRFPYLLPNIILVKNKTATNIFDPLLNCDFSIN